MDSECVIICDALNALPRIRTLESCCGHGETGFRVFFGAGSTAALEPIVKAAHSSAWQVRAGWANGSDLLYFILEGPIGPSAQPGGADDFAQWLNAQNS